MPAATAALPRAIVLAALSCNFSVLLAWAKSLSTSVTPVVIRMVSVPAMPSIFAATARLGSEAKLKVSLPVVPSIHGAEAGPVLPAESVAVAVKVRMTLGLTEVPVLQFPLSFALAVPTSVTPSNTLTVLFASAVPARVQVPPMRVLVISTAAGAVVSRVTASAESSSCCRPCR